MELLICSTASSLVATSCWKQTPYRSSYIITTDMQHFLMYICLVSQHSVTCKVSPSYMMAYIPVCGSMVLYLIQAPHLCLLCVCHTFFWPSHSAYLLIIQSLHIVWSWAVSWSMHHNLAVLHRLWYRSHVLYTVPCPEVQSSLHIVLLRERWENSKPTTTTTWHIQYNHVNVYANLFHLWQWSSISLSTNGYINTSYGEYYGEGCVIIASWSGGMTVQDVNIQRTMLERLSLLSRLRPEFGGFNT